MRTMLRHMAKPPEHAQNRGRSSPAERAVVTLQGRSTWRE